MTGVRENIRGNWRKCSLLVFIRR